MKTATKVFLILGIVSGAFMILYGLYFIVVFAQIFGLFEIIDAAVSNSVYSWYVLYLLIFYCLPLFGILGVVFSSIALGKLGKARRASDISVGFKVCVLLFANLIGGILLLCMKDSDYSPQIGGVNYGNPPPPNGYYYPPGNGQPPYGGNQPPYNGYPPYGNPPPPNGYYYPPGNGQPPYGGNQPPYNGYPPYGNPPPPNGYYYPPGSGQPPYAGNPPPYNGYPPCDNPPPRKDDGEHGSNDDKN